jgi:hypothetical protein
LIDWWGDFRWPSVSIFGVVVVWIWVKGWTELFGRRWPVERGRGIWQVLGLNCWQFWVWENSNLISSNLRGFGGGDVIKGGTSTCSLTGWWPEVAMASVHVHVAEKYHRRMGLQFFLCSSYTRVNLHYYSKLWACWLEENFGCLGLFMVAGFLVDRNLQFC